MCENYQNIGPLTMFVLIHFRKSCQKRISRVLSIRKHERFTFSLHRIYFVFRIKYQEKKRGNCLNLFCFWWFEQNWIESRTSVATWRHEMQEQEAKKLHPKRRNIDICGPKERNIKKEIFAIDWIFLSMSRGYDSITFTFGNWIFLQL